MQRAMGYAGAWHIDMSRFAQEQLPPQVYLTASYYQRWALAMESNVVERGYADAEELAAGHALRAGQAAQAQAHDRRRPAGHDARLVLPPGAGARALQAGRPGAHQEHPSADAYPAAALRARQGRRGRARATAATCSRIRSRSTTATIRNGSTPWCSTARELWGPDADPTLKVSIDAFEPYLEPA